MAVREGCCTSYFVGGERSYIVLVRAPAQLHYYYQHLFSCSRSRANLAAARKRRDRKRGRLGDSCRKKGIPQNNNYNGWSSAVICTVRSGQAVDAPTGTHVRAPRDDDAGQFQECLLKDENQLDRLHGRREKALCSGPQAAGMAVDSTGRGFVGAELGARHNRYFFGF